VEGGATLPAHRWTLEEMLEYWDGQMDLFDSNPQREVKEGEKVVVFDLETQRSFAEVGGRSQFHRLGVSVGVAYRYDRDEFMVVTEDTISDLVNLILEAELVVGYNIRGFDYEVLRAYTDEEFRSPEAPDRCMWCGRPATAEAVWARAY